MREHAQQTTPTRKWRLGRPRTLLLGRGRTLLPAVAVASTLALAACSGNSTGQAGTAAATTGGSGTLDITSFVPFSGADGSFGPLALSGCYPAVYAINKAGGVLGHKLACSSADTRGDPVDAVPAADALVAHDSNVVAVFGPSSDEALSTVPLLEQAHLPLFLMAGLSAYDHQTNPYVWRLTPADAAEGYAMAAWAHQKGYTRAAAVFATGSASEGDGPAAISGFTKLGGKIVANISLTPDQSSYQTEVSQIVSSRPQVIFFTAPASTSATFFAELSQLGSILPTYVTEVAEEPDWISAVSGAIGSSALSKNFVAFEPQTAPTTSAGWKTFDSAMFASPQQVPTTSQYTDDPFSLTYYDAANLVALAMLEAKSVSPQAFDSRILPLTQPGPGKVVVHDFAAGAKAIAAGKQVQYIGASGPLVLNSYHNVAGDFSGLSVQPKPVTLGQVPVSLMTQAES